jgi:UDP-N-acetylmuramoyl-L-alanyl-D-glutamate--2,6-diaminopimelate ligase
MTTTDLLTIRPLAPRGVKLSFLCSEFALKPIGDIGSVVVTGVTIDSRDVRPGDLYVGMPGAHHHGASFYSEALARGAVGMFTDEAGWEIVGKSETDTELIGAVLPEPRSALGSISACVFDTAHFDAKFFGVTGTNGKTSVIYMLAALLDALGETTGMSSTAERRIGDEAIVSALTSPESSELHALLARMRERQVTAVTIEVSAQAVVRNRLDGVNFDVVAFNNLSQDHLDEFSTMEQYFAAKAKLFTPEHASRAVVVVDSEWGKRIAAQASIPVTTLATEYGSSADWHLAVTRETLDSTAFVLNGPSSVSIRASVPLIGRFMAENAALAMIMLIEAGYSADQITAALGLNHELDVYIPGRLEKISGDAGPRFYVDYGHTPGAFAAMLDALENVAEGRIIMMFGADGDRDSSKRHAMGAIAAKGSDVLIICDYNPRSEDPFAIRRALIEGATESGGRAQILEIADPATAIREAIKIAGSDDVILYAGPGHEEFREVAGEHIPFSARDEVRGALREAGFTV